MHNPNDCFSSKCLYLVITCLGIYSRISTFVFGSFWVIWNLLVIFNWVWSTQESLACKLWFLIIIHSHLCSCWLSKIYVTTQNMYVHGWMYLRGATRNFVFPFHHHLLLFHWFKCLPWCLFLELVPSVYILLFSLCLCVLLSLTHVYHVWVVRSV